MRSIRYACLLVLMLVGALAHGQGFNPDTPPEPNPMYRLTLKSDPAEAATVTGTGMYLDKTRVSVRTEAKGPEWVFVNWTDADGTEVSASSSFTYTTTAADVTLVANYRQTATSQLTVKSNPESLFTTTVTTYAVGAQVRLYCYNYSNYTFINWTDDTGAEVGTEQTLNYTVTENDRIVTANYKFTPGTPAEPSETKPKHRVYFTTNPAGAGYFNQTSGMSLSEDAEFSVYTYRYDNYVFVNWTDPAGTVLGTNNRYDGVMGTDDIHLIANYVFKPSTPSDPGEPAGEHHTMYLPTVQMYQGATAYLPVYLENTSDVKSLAFSLVLPENVEALTDGILTTSRTSAFTPAATQEGRIVRIIVDGGSLVAEHNGVLLYVPVRTTRECEDGEYEVAITDAEALLTDGTSVLLTSRKGYLEIVTLEEGDLQAQFSIDRYINRIQCTNMTGENARTYLWEFGDGTTSTEVSPMHIYAAPGTYIVKLTAKAVIKESTAEQVIVINGPESWTAGGDYTIDPTAKGIRNFESLLEMAEILSQCSIESNINVEVFGSELTETVDNELTLAYFEAMAVQLSEKGYKTTLRSADGECLININVDPTYTYYSTLIQWMENVNTEGVTIIINGINVNPQVLQALTQQTIADGETTIEVNLVDAIYGDGVDVAWTAKVTEGTTLTGYEVEGEGNIPAMTLHSAADVTESVEYEVTYACMGVKIYTKTYTIYVSPTFAQITDSDYAALKVLYAALQGEDWSTKWNIESREITPDNWAGVTFDDDGNVIAVSLSNRNIRGTLPESGFEMPYLETLVLSRNDIKGNLPEFVSALPSLKVLDMSYCMLESIDRLLPTHIVDLKIDHQYSGRSISGFTFQQWTMGEYIAEVELSTIISYNHEAQDWSARPALRLYSNDYYTDAYLEYDEDMGAYAIKFNGVYNIDNNAEVQIVVKDGSAEGCRMRAIIEWLTADANADGAVDIADAQHTLNYVLGRSTGNFNYKAANTYTDATINIQDIVATVNIILDTTSVTPAYAYGPKESAQARLYATTEAVVLESHGGIAALDFTLQGVSSGDISLALDPAQFSMVTRDTADGVRVILISPCGAEIPAGAIRLLRNEHPCAAVRAIGADVDATRVAIDIAGPTGMESVASDTKDDVMYDLSGRRLPSKQASSSHIIIINGKKTMK